MRTRNYIQREVLASRAAKHGAVAISLPGYLVGAAAVWRSISQPPPRAL
jgi:hypothetical protein